MDFWLQQELWDNVDCSHKAHYLENKTARFIDFNMQVSVFLILGQILFCSTF